MGPEPSSHNLVLVESQKQQYSLKTPKTQVFVWYVVMGFREVLLLGFVLLLSSGNLRADTQNLGNFSENETWKQIPITTRLPQTRDHHSNSTEYSNHPRSPVVYRLKIYQLRDPAVSEQNPLRALMEQLQTPQNLHGSEQLEPMETSTVPPQWLLVPGPDLNPPVKQESKVLFFCFLTSTQLCWSSV